MTDWMRVDVPNPTCVVDGCSKPARSPKADWCPMHYHRWYRHGRVDVTAKGITVGPERCYVGLSNPNHPLADVNGRVWQHRMVLFDAIGYGPHECHWCGVSIDWLPKGTKGELHVDHLNNKGDDNRLDNLAPSCRTCNAARGVQHRSQVLREAGWWSHHDTVALTGGGRKPPIAA